MQLVGSSLTMSDNTFERHANRRPTTVSSCWQQKFSAIALIKCWVLGSFVTCTLFLLLQNPSAYQPLKHDTAENWHFCFSLHQELASRQVEWLTHRTVILICVTFIHAALLPSESVLVVHSENLGGGVPLRDSVCWTTWVKWIMWPLRRFTAENTDESKPVSSAMAFHLSTKLHFRRRQIINRFL